MFLENHPKGWNDISIKILQQTKMMKQIQQKSWQLLHFSGLIPLLCMLKIFIIKTFKEQEEYW